MSRTADDVESLLGLCADPGGARTAVVPAMLADQLVGVGSRVVITRKSDDANGTRRTYFLTLDMPAKETDGLPTTRGSAEISDAIQMALSARGWQHQLLQRSVGSFDHRTHTCSKDFCCSHEVTTATWLRSTTCLRSPPCSPRSPRSGRGWRLRRRWW
jgi:hypothetical protein